MVTGQTCIDQRPIQVKVVTAETCTGQRGYSSDMHMTVLTRHTCTSQCGNRHTCTSQCGNRRERYRSLWKQQRLRQVSGNSRDRYKSVW